jgi:hypothetical protein
MSRSTLNASDHSSPAGAADAADRIRVYVFTIDEFKDAAPLLRYLSSDSVQMVTER